MRSRFQKIAAWLLIINGIIGVLFISIFLLHGVQLTLLQIVGAFLFPALGVLSGALYLRGMEWAGWAGAVFYGIQVVRYHSQSFNFDWRSGIEMTIRPGGIEEALRNVPTFEINLAAVLFLFLQVAAITRRTPSTGKVAR